jgi:hypothetical protein
MLRHVNLVQPKLGLVKLGREKFENGVDSHTTRRLKGNGSVTNIIILAIIANFE